jgi:galactose oxidase-like protein
VQNCNRVSKSSWWLLTAMSLILLLSASLVWGQASKTSSKAAPGAGAPAVDGSWTAPAMLCPPNGHCLVGANLALMNNGKVLFYYFPRPGSGPGSRAVVLDPVTGVVTDVVLTASRDIFCSGITILPNGQVMSTGGNAPNPPNNHSGTWNTDIFDPATNTWTLATNMNYARWYPSTIELANGLALEVSGSNEVGSKVQNVMETYDYHTGVWTVLPTSANLPPVLLDGTAYPRLTLLTSGKVFASSPSAKTYVFDPTANTWTFQSGTNFGKRYYSGHVLLPGLNKVLVSGGSPISSNGAGTTTNTAEVIDFSTKRPIWQYISPMNIARMNHNLVLLPDGTVLAVGGGCGGGRFACPILTPELYDPVAGTWTQLAPQTGFRTYHSTAAVMPDGRVLSAGADDKGIYQQTYELFSPPYLFKGARPTITSSPSTLTYAQQFTINTPDAASITRVAMMRPSATTHADDMDQRYVDLTFTIGSGQITATAPANANMAPPGYYMLVIVNSSGVPSVMPFLQIM